MRPLTRKIAALSGSLLLAGTLAACGSSGSGGSGGDGANAGDLSKVACPLPALAKASGPVKVSFWYGGLVGNAKTVMQDTVKAYNASQSKVVVQAADQGKDYDSLLNKYTAAIPNRIPSIVYAENNKAQFLADSGTIIPGGACAKEGAVPVDHIVPAVRSYYTVDGAFVPGAVNVSGLELYYNKRLFQAAGLPMKAPGTLAELRTDAEALKKSGVEFPISMKVDSWFFEVLLGGIGKPMVDHDNGHDGRATKAVFDTPQAVTLLKTLKSMYDDGLIAKISNTPGQINHYLNMAQGKSGILMETSTAATTIEAFLGCKVSASDLGAGDLGSIDSSVKLVPGFGEMPGIDKPGQVEVNGGAFFVTNGGTAAQQAGAMDFMKFVNQVPQQVKWHVDGSYLPSNDQVASQPAVKEFWKGQIAGLSLKIASQQLAGVDASRSGPVIGPYDEYDSTVQKMMESVLLNDADPAKALAKAQVDVTKAIEQYNKTNGF
jgi:sn-glycerol 3-phosphate transport system substrate-binding protein